MKANCNWKLVKCFIVVSGLLEQVYDEKISHPSKNIEIFLTKKSLLKKDITTLHVDFMMFTYFSSLINHEMTIISIKHPS